MKIKDVQVLKHKINGLLFYAYPEHNDRTGAIYYKVCMLKDHSSLNFSISKYLEYLEKYFEIIN